jgi:hypothetical protein
VLICSKRKYWWLVCSERKVLLAGADKPSEQGDDFSETTLQRRKSTTPVVYTLRSDRDYAR